MSHLPARNTDPDTSHEAARDLVDSGTQAQQQAQVASALRQHPGLTSRELAFSACLDRHMVARRLPELEAEGLAVHGAPRICSMSRKRCQTWLPVLDRADQVPLAA
ncbi:winged helix-turn-helix domain-containing protein [Stenotrophomonas sp. CFBP 13718]|uniref:winged helix-turn-helix domain-containing protein n=1 Tax=Stenotrophomonas sp. CFBP 13718 TaxID=2775304 RepID=UPI00178402EE|nr:winged helix-turn-helix domain-containing protein [Stenotrophomonas sp. CFBP 13718]MBD8696574.1 winged helix-turn-helix domain-containing protein [Stenotrophomonas sp. CFBP 13718]